MFLIVDEDGHSILTGALVFWFWTALVCIGAFAFKFVASNYREVDHFH